MRVLVIGGAGFIGSHLVRRLIDEGYGVDVLDNYLNSCGLRNLCGCNVIYGDAVSGLGLEPCIEAVDTVFHLAVRSLPEGLENPDEVFLSNVMGTYNVARACATYEKKMVFVSSCEAYGFSDDPLRETNPLNPVTVYGSSKASSEMIVKAFHHSYNLRYAIIRPFNAVGPYVRTDRYAPAYINFIKRVRAKKPPIIHGSGQQTRDFISVRDLAEGIVLVDEGEDKLVHHEVINLGTGVETSINDLALLIVKIYPWLPSLGENLEPVYTERRRGDVERMYADVSQAEKLLGFRAKITLEEELRRVADWYENTFG